MSTHRFASVGSIVATLAFLAGVAVAPAAHAQSPLPIADIHARLGTLTGTTVTVEGVVTVPINYRGPTTYNGYIQDGSGRGTNLFGGSTAPPNASSLNTVGNRVRVTGEVQVFSNTTVELSNISDVTFVSSGSPVPPIQLSTAAANDARWEGTLIEVSGTIDSISAVVGQARNYYINDGSGRTVARVYNAIGAPQFSVDQHVTARGAGTNFNGLYEFYVGQASDIQVTTPGPDILPPLLVGAWAAAASQAKITFGEAVETSSGGTASNYQIFETANPGNTVAVNSASVSGPVVTLTLGSSLANGTGYTVRVSNVADTEGNALQSPATLAFSGPSGPSDTTPPTLSSASALSLTSVRATFSEAIDPATGGSTANYSVFETANPGNTVSVSSVVVNATTATLTLGSNLTGGTNYTLRAQNIQDVSGNPMPTPQTATFNAPGGSGATPIADIHANLPLYLHQSVTVQGQVYIPTNYRAPATTITGYIQDTSGRGINLFGSTANNPLLQDLGNIVQVTGTVDTFGTTTVEILNLTNVTLISSGNPPLQAVHQTTGQAANARWEGTYVETTGTISSISTTGGSAPATNYTVNDGSGPIVIRVINALGAPTFVVGNEITGRGAGSHFRTDYQILVGKASDVFLGSGGDTTPPNLTSATTPSLTSVRATFNEAIDSTTGATAANYSVFETANQSNTIGITSAAVTGVSATLTLASSLTSGTNYSLRAQNVKDTAGNTMPAPQTVTFTASVGPAVLPIAELQNNFSRYKGQQVTVRGQVYIPNNYRGTTASGYIQDESGRGINVFGNAGANNALLQNLGNIVTVTGTADTFFTTNEITNPSATLFSSGNPPLQPVALTTGDAASRAWEGTYILVTGNITAKATTGSPPTAFNYTMDDGSGPIVARVVTALNAPEFNVGQLITARGAGSLFNADYQVLVGTRDGIIEGRPQDTFPPSIVRALSDGGTTLSVEFNEAVTQATAEVAANYEVFRTSNPTQTIAVQSARLAENTRVELSLASALDPGLGFSVRVRHVTDLLGNAIPAAGVTRTVEVAPAEAVSLSGPPFTFLPRQGEAYPLTFTVTSEVAGGSGEVLLRIFDVNGQLKRTLFDSRFDQNAFANNRATRTWDGRDDTQQIVPAGTYVAHLLVTPKRTSNDRQAVQIPVVVATRLDR